MPRKKKEPTFEELLEQLQANADRLEQGNLPLEASLALYEEGAALVEQVREMLDGAELRITEVSARLQASEQHIEEVDVEYDEDPGDD